MDQAGPSSSNQDPRYDFIGSYAVKSLKLKPEKWMRVLSVEEHRSTLKDFVDKPLPLLLVVVLTHAAQLVPVISFPCYLKNKAVYFVKKKPDVIPKENCAEMVIFGKYFSFFYTNQSNQTTKYCLRYRTIEAKQCWERLHITITKM